MPGKSGFSYRNLLNNNIYIRVCHNHIIMTKESNAILYEVTPLSSDDCLYVIERKKREFSFPLHRHKEYELNYIENASGALRIVGDSIEEIGDYDLVLITSENLEHVWKNHHCRSTEIREITIQFSGDLFNNTLFERNQFLTIKKMIERAQKGLSFPLSTILKVRSLLNSLVYGENGFYSVMDFFLLLYQLSISNDVKELSSSAFAQCAPPIENNRIKLVDDFLKQNHDKEISVAQAARIVNMSEVAFSRFFKRHTGKSFTDYLINLRIGNVIRLLVDTDKTISEICYECGFNNISNFNKLFKARKGYSPKEFRQIYKKKKIIY